MVTQILVFQKLTDWEHLNSKDDGYWIYIDWEKLSNSECEKDNYLLYIKKKYAKEIFLKKIYSLDAYC